ncbi:MAG: penicillin-binding protein 2 [Actinomycetota bacterium]|jgi:penicillin-binding protein 2
MDTDSPRLRLSILFVVVAACFVVLFGRLWYLQVMAAPALAESAEQTRIQEVFIEAPRGRIIDVKGRVIVDNRTSLIVTIDRKKFKSDFKSSKQDELLAKLADMLTANGAPTKVSTLKARLDDQRYSDFQQVPVATDVTDEVIHTIAERNDEFPTMSYERKTVRVYPYGAAAGNILGYTGRITAELKDKLVTANDPDGIPKTYQINSTIGLAGIEKQYEQYLRGTPGVERIEFDSKGRRVRVAEYQEPKAGSDVQLHIDMDVQLRAEQALSERLAVLRNTPQRDGAIRRAPAGSMVALDPQTGGVIALATYPTYDPREFINGLSQERYDQLQNVNGVSALIDRSISGAYAPGSTFKLVTAVAAMNNGLITRVDSLYDPGFYEVGNPPQRFTNAGEQVNGMVDVIRGLSISSDVFFYWLGARMDGTTLIQDTAASFGFDKATGIDLPNESPGYVLTPAEKRELVRKYPESYQDGNWYTGDNVQLAIGQNVIVVTPLQLARAYAAFANGGTLYKPHVAWRILRPDTDLNQPIRSSDVLETFQPEVVGTISMSPETRDAIAAGLAGATVGAGTAASAFGGWDMNAFPVAGKTGTAQVVNRADTSLFGAWAPFTNPRIAIAAVMEESGFGAEAAGAAVRRTLEVVANQRLTDAADAPTVGNKD